MAKPLTIGLVLDTSLDPPDGVQQYVIGIGEWLRSQGHAVHYLVGQTEHRQLPNIHSLSRNITVRFNGNKTTIPLFAKHSHVRQVLQENNFDILHVQTPHHPLLAQRLILAADSRTAIIGTFHIAAYGRLVTIGNWLLSWWLRPSLKRFDRIVSVSSAAADFAHQTFGVKTDVLSNVINYNLFHSAKPLPAYNDNCFTILFLNRLVPRKGCQLLLEAITLLDKQNLPPFRVLICGKGPQAEKLNQYIHTHNLQDIVTMVGFVSEEDKPRYYASADLAVFPSSGGESFGIVLPEAMASGQSAVLAGDNPGYRSVMQPRPELLFNPHNAHELAQKITAYMRDKKLRQAAAQWGASYSQQFDVQVVGKQLVSMYHEALRKRRRQ